MPETPGKLGRPHILQHRLFPGLAVYLDLDRGDRGRSPGHSANSVTSVPLCDSRRRGLEQNLADRRLDAGSLPVLLLLTNCHIVAAHESAHIARIAYLDPAQPFHVGNTIPTRCDQTYRKTISRRQGRAVHLIADEVGLIHGVLDRHATPETYVCFQLERRTLA